MEVRHQLVKDALDEWKEGPIHLLEIGIRHGETFGALRDYLNSRKIEYTGVDIKFYTGGVHEPSHRSFEIDSVEFWKTLPVHEFFHVIFVDGCHGGIHADLDTKGALLHLHLNGILLIHDTGCDDEVKHPRQDDPGCFGAFCRNCMNRPELEARISRTHSEGMGIVKKLGPIGRQFLWDTEIIFPFCCDVCEVFGSKPCPSVREAFPLYFGDEHAA